MQGFLDNLRLAFGTFVASPLRSLLTLLGIVIGVATVVAMMALIEGLRLKVTRDLSMLGADSFSVSKWPSVGFGRMDWRKFSRRPNFTLADRDAVVEQSHSVLAASAHDTERGQKISTSLHATRPDVNVYGATSEWPETTNLEVAQGRFFTLAEELDGRDVAVVGPDVADVLFPAVEAVGQEIRVRGRPYAVIGVLERRGSFLGLASQDNLVVLPMRSFQVHYGKRRSVRINIQAKDASVLDRAQEEVTLVLRRRRDLAPLAPNDFEVDTNDSMTKTFNSLSQVITAASFGVCVLSLVVGGIGILNIMLVSVTERTKEIGIRRALGARRRRILGQFATEAIALSLVGGLIGIAIGFGVAFLARWVIGFPAVVPAWAVILSVVMSSVVGLVFGIYPAMRAARLDPVEAMRSE